MKECCENCKFWKWLGYYYYECTNEESERNGRYVSLRGICNKFEMENSQELSPRMKLWHDLKSNYPDAILLFRCGVFYETYNIDAKECANILGITLTWRNKTFPHNHETYEGAMAGFPRHALDTYLPKLIYAGKRVAFYDQEIL